MHWPIRSAGLNFAFGYGVVFVLSAIFCLSFIWWNTTGQLDRSVQAAVQIDARDLQQRWLHGGVEDLTIAIQDRLDQNVEDDELYLLTGPDGRKYAGNLPGWPVVIGNTNKFYELTIRRDGLRSQAKLHAYHLSAGYQLIVGRDIKGRQLVRHVLTDTLIWAGVMITLFAVGGALVIRRIFRQVVHSIVRTTSAVAQGDLGQRIPLVGNETDLVAHTINTMLERINRLMDGVKQVSNAIAHDLRTPITRARTRLEDASLHAFSDGELRAAIDRAISDLDHITSIFEALLRIAQLEAGARRSAFTVVELKPLLENLYEFYDLLSEEKGIKLNLRIKENGCVKGDPQLIQQAVANMLDNAIKFSPSNTEITLTSWVEREKVRIAVIDQGAGMPPEDIKRASERFFRAESSRHTQGSGLGLSLVQAVVNLHGGTMELSNCSPGFQVVLSFLVMNKKERKEVV
ncbi:HAMP domain-containing histidine kinase [Swingsia samuiensis]|uniref:histidine kinase n=2 Tax=Swingsia samuiensis TaxID=1293412 RepID=A0A4Y6UK90_9PROT|nr:HAMP domain-containing histidine kinase [Swingsia samuiensis]